MLCLSSTLVVLSNAQHHRDISENNRIPVCALTFDGRPGNLELMIADGDVVTACELSRAEDVRRRFYSGLPAFMIGFVWPWFRGRSPFPCTASFFSAAVIEDFCAVLEGVADTLTSFR